MNRRTMTSTLVVLLASMTALGQNLNTGAHNLIEVASGIYAVEPVLAGADGAIIVNESGVIVIDTHSTPASSATLIDAVQQLTDKPIRYVINTHWHVDHHSGNEAYANLYGSQVDFIAHDHTRDDIPTLGREQYEQTAPYRTMPLDSANEMLDSGHDGAGNPLNDDQQRAIRKFHDAQEAFLATADQFKFTLPNLTIDDSLTLHGDPYTVKVKYLYPAHTRGDVVVFVPEAKILIVGDILTKPILWTWSSYPRDYIRTLTEVELLDFDKMIIGHGGPVLEDKSYLITAREFMEAIVAFVDQANAMGTSAEEAIEQGASHPGIQAFRRRFVSDSEQENQMFDQMVGWTIDRVFLELSQ